MRAEIITIGDEICAGDIVDTNSPWLANWLSGYGIAIDWISSCRDRQADIVAGIELAITRSRIVILSGGLGPTSDDLTVDVISDLVGATPVVDDVAFAKMEQRYRERDRTPDKDSGRQCRVPKGAQVFANSVGLAPGFAVTFKDAHLFCLPGPPRELKAVAVESMTSQIEKIAGPAAAPLETRVYRIFGRGESEIGVSLEGLVDSHPSVSVHYRASFPEVQVKLVKEAPSSTPLSTFDDEMKRRVGSALYAISNSVASSADDSLAATLVKELKDHKQTIATAESCTGGGLGAMITDNPGASAAFLGGAVTYADSAKVSRLGVSEATLKEHGAVSEACVLEMAKGVREAFGTDIGVAISGVAGPGGGTKEKPVGTVWVAVAHAAGEFSQRIFWQGSRSQVRRIAAFAAMSMALKTVRNNLDG